MSQFAVIFWRKRDPHNGEGNSPAACITAEESDFAGALQRWAQIP
jgi:hypothetical protein